MVHAATTRHGGVSAPPFDTLNLGATTGDAAENVRTNHARFYEALHLRGDRVVTAQQAQADRWARVDERHCGTRLPQVDALMTDAPQVPLLLRFADCVPILLADPVRRAIALVHSGWRGTTQRILTRTVEGMHLEFGTRPADLSAFIGPSIGPCCYEIGADVAERVRSSFPEAALLLIRQNGSLHLDLWEANAHQLRALGVTRVETAGLCTADRTDEFFSWRREWAHTGRLAAVISLP